MRYFVLLLCLMATLVATGCRTAPAAPPEPAQAQLGEAFTLAGGQGTAVSGENLTLEFDQVLEDSRCPKQVECFWTGQALLTVLVQREGQAPVPVEFNTNPAPGQNKQQANVGAYTIRLISLDPYPETPATIPLDDYRAVMLVNKN